MLVYVVVILLLLSPLAAGAGEKPNPAAEPPKTRKLTAAELRTFYTDPVGQIVTDWTDTAQDTRTFRSFVKAGYATVLSEGKMEDGHMVFRKAYKHVSDFYPDSEKLMWCTYN